MARFIAIALALCFASATFAAAQVNDPGKPFSETEKEKIIAVLSQMGYTAPSNFRRDGDGFLATAMKDSKQQDVWVDPQSGVVKPISK
jgi:hypothetical protein